MSEDQKLIFKAIPKIIDEIEAVTKKKSLEGGVKYAFRRIDDFMNALNPMLGKHKVTLLPEVLDVTRGQVDTNSGGKMNTVQIKARYTLFAEDGSCVSGITIGEGFDSGDKASGKAQSNALKYFIMPTFMVPTEDIDDTDNDASPELEQKPRLTVNYADLSSFVMPYGNKEVKGKKLSDIKPEALSAACQYFVNKAKEDKKEIQGDMKVTLEACSKWLQQLKEVK